MVGVTYRSATARPQTGKGVPLPVLPPSHQQTSPEVIPPSFRDKESYQELFKPLPKPEPPPQLIPFKVEAKSWKQLQEEREAMMNKELEKTKQEAMSMWNRTKEDDEKRVAKINADKKFRDEEFMKREEIMRRGQEERLAADLARKEEIRRQEELLSGRRIRAKTTDLSVDKPEGGGIQIYHYKDPAVEQIVRKTYKEEMRRRMSHGEILKLSETSNQPPSGFSATVTTGQVNHAMGLVTNNTNEYNAVMNGKPGYFKSNMMDRSQSSSSNTSR